MTFLKRVQIAQAVVLYSMLANEKLVASSSDILFLVGLGSTLSSSSISFSAVAASFLLEKSKPGAIYFFSVFILLNFLL